MPLYECRCEACDLTFEVLAPLSDSGMRSRRCPECGRRSRRVISTVSFAVSKDGRMPRERQDATRSDVTRLSVPLAARPCWMDDRSAARFAAYKHGRGAEYDDTVSAREELRKQRGLPPDNSPSHSHHSHQPSPLADPTVLAHRKEAARKTKIAASKEITGHRNSPA
jgi:putative FmdB family regulatory protein